ncbi:MAG: hypothetical protein Kow0069_25630 [Promethearchaeota archaeon]
MVPTPPPLVNVHKFLRAAPAVAVACAIFVLSSLSSPLALLPGGPPQPSPVTLLLGVAFHAGEFALLSFFACWAWERPRYALTVTAVVLYAATDELHQAFVPGRVADLTDLALDGIGAVLGALAFYLLATLRERRQKTN